MNLPPDPLLPFFAYGVFKPGELAFLQIKPLVTKCVNCSIPGTMSIRDGLPIASLDKEGVIRGALITFRAGFESEAYSCVAALEPEKQYLWKTIEGNFGKANLLAERSSNKGSVYPEEEWDGRKDPLFMEALDVVLETLVANRQAEWDLKPLFRLEMAYLLLWTAIERYCSLRYHLGNRATEKVRRIANEPAFHDSLLEHVSEKRAVQRADDPSKKEVLDRDNPKGSLEYYYQIRSNLVHRGKGVIQDHERIAKSLAELLGIFRHVLNVAFANSSWNAPEQVIAANQGTTIP